MTGLNVEEEAAALEGVTIEAANTTNRAAAIDPAQLEARLRDVSTLEVLNEIYKENPLHSEFAQLFTERKLDILQLTGQLK